MSIKGDEILIGLCARPKLGRRKAASIGLREPDDLHQALSPPNQANRLVARLSQTDPNSPVGTKEPDRSVAGTAGCNLQIRTFDGAA